MSSNTPLHTTTQSLRDRIVRCVRKLDDLPTEADIRPRSAIGDFDLGPAQKPVSNISLTAAAVLVPIVKHPHRLSILLTKRTNHLHDHPGQISFPGGRTEKIDNGPITTALRETKEEIGLEASFIEVVGFLDAYETTTRYLVIPVVGLITPGFQLNPDYFEVAEIFQMPLSFLLDPSNHQIQSRTIKGIRCDFYALEYERHFIWGATAGMLINLYHRIMETSR
uniref:8-oxo-dGTP pyrophosphatase MutT, NUDIX family n=1 Tax=Candidatus Kentrum sp. LFY TaxID=2126342 RepID=A0A450UZY2_9GAMM|nr:MAG: 8-oxo-dGTP pyrophosphatase MutT, NUDIX family [Candidatus Kentron sp. LFY]